MKSTDAEEYMVARATIGSYFVLSGIYFLLAAINIGLVIQRGWITGVGWILLILLSAGTAWVIWLRGFKITISEGILLYRNGFYKTASVPINDIQQVRHAWVEWRTFGRLLRAPRVVIIRKGAKLGSIEINPKPFSRDAIKTLLDIKRTG